MRLGRHTCAVVVPRTCGAHIGIFFSPRVLYPPLLLLPGVSGLRTIWVTGAPPAYIPGRPRVSIACLRFRDDGLPTTVRVRPCIPWTTRQRTARHGARDWNARARTERKRRKQIRCRWTGRGPSSWWRRRCWCISCRRVRSLAGRNGGND